MIKEFISKWAVALRWWLQFTIINVLMVVLYMIGIVDKFNDVDFTKISFLIFVLFYIFTLRNGWISYKISKKQYLNHVDIDTYSNNLEPGLFISRLLFQLGLIGTVIGMSVMLDTSLATISISNFTSMQSAISQMSSGMATALYTTIAGLICGNVLRIQLFDISHHLNKCDSSHKFHCDCKEVLKDENEDE